MLQEGDEAFLPVGRFDLCLWNWENLGAVKFLHCLRMGLGEPGGHCCNSEPIQQGWKQDDLPAMDPKGLLERGDDPKFELL